MTLINVLVDTYRDGVIKAFESGMRGLNNPHKTYGTKARDDSDFKLDLESDDVDKFMNNTVECTISNLEIIDQTSPKNNQEQPFMGDNSTIEMGASLAYTHFSDKTQSSERKNLKKTTDQPTQATKTSTGPQESSSTQSHFNRSGV